MSGCQYDGIGINHFAGSLFSRITGVQLINVPYKGGAQALTDLIGGQVQIMWPIMSISLPQVQQVLACLQWAAAWAV